MANAGRQPRRQVFSRQVPYSFAHTVIHINFLIIFHAFLSSADFSKSIFLNKSFRNTIGVSNSLDPDQAQHLVGPDLGLNCLQRPSAEDTSIIVCRVNFCCYITGRISTRL